MPIVDRHALEYLTKGDEAMLAELIAIFVQNLSDIERRMELAIRELDGETLSDVAHQMKSRLSYFAAAEMSDLAVLMEGCGCQGDFETAMRLLSQMQLGVRKMLDELGMIAGITVNVIDDEFMC